MPSAIRTFVRSVDWLNYWVGRAAMYLIFVLAAVLLYATASRVALGLPVNWALEMSQFLLSAYYLLGGAYAMQLGAHVRMDLFYNRFSARRRAQVDEEIRPVRRPRGAPAEPALDRTDVRHAAHVAVAHLFLPRR